MANQDLRRAMVSIPSSAYRNCTGVELREPRISRMIGRIAVSTRLRLDLQAEPYAINP